MREIWDFIVKFSEFLTTYGMMKCVKTMIAGTVMLCFILLFQKFFGKKSANRNFYAFLLLLPMALMAMNKIFFLPGFVYISAFINNMKNAVYGRLYFTIMAFLLFIFLSRNLKAAKFRKKLPLFSDSQLKDRAIVCITSDDTFRISEHYLKKTKIYVSDQETSPYCGGIIRPFIVLPTKIVNNWDNERQFSILCHEMLHLKSGHIVWITLFHLLKIYWWINPLIYFAERDMLEQMEMACDEKCVMKSRIDAESYGRLLLGIAGILLNVKREGVATFLSGSDFHMLKKRVLYLKKCSRKKDESCKDKHQDLKCIMILAAMCVAIAATSYPRYTVIEEISLYDEDLRLICEDVNQTMPIVRVLDGELVIDEERFDLLMKAYQIEGDYVYLSFDTIMKVPGVGGCGNAGMVSTHDYQDIFYLSADCIENDIMEFWLKYLI